MGFKFFLFNYNEGMENLYGELRGMIGWLQGKRKSGRYTKMNWWRGD